ncbi:MAG: asparagine synthase (glutamine-hydrolyzing) [Acidobacteria bacterium]|nr:asparagine synthase (glutamine-hydrolyzing) [Acidobacteriota bacterium]
MCGIAGIVGEPLNGIDAHVERMSGAIAHRGPDDAGVKVWPARENVQAAFAFRRLAIIDTSAAGHQPMSTPDGRFTIVFNGEIYNYRTLRDGLHADGIETRTETDTEVLLLLFRQRGAACLDFLQGMYAFAVRDNETGKVFIARDRLGIKPLYYYQQGGRLLFSSELRSLLASGQIPRVLDPVSLSSYLSFGAVQEPRTMIRNVRTLPPAHYMEVDAYGQIVNSARYWSLPSDKFKGNRREALEETHARLGEAVRSHLVADVPLGAFLSGGIDSSAVVALMARYSTARVHAVSVTFQEAEFSESAYARHVAEKWAITHTEVVLSEHELLDSLPAAVADIDQPTIDGINTWIVSRATREAGLTVALSGLGGDELFGGYPSFRRVPRSLKYAALLKAMGAKNRERAALLVEKVIGDSLRSQKVAAIIANGESALSSYAAVRGLFSMKSRKALLGEGGRGAVGAEVENYLLPAEALELLQAVKTNGDVINKVSQYELSLYMANMLLRDTDAMSMAHALEVRVPFLDHRLVEWVYALPGVLKMGRRPKPLLTEALGDALPTEVVHRRKMGFTLPFEKWLHTALKPFVQEVLNNTVAVERAGLNPSAVLEVLGKFMSGSHATSWSRVWSLVILVDWCTRHAVELDSSVTSF